MLPIIVGAAKKITDLKDAIPHSWMTPTVSVERFNRTDQRMSHLVATRLKRVVCVSVWQKDGSEIFSFSIVRSLQMIE